MCQVSDAVDTVVYAPDNGWWYHPKHVEQFPDINKLCNVASRWIYIGIYRAILWLEAPNTLGKVFQNLEKRIQVCLDVKGDQFQLRL